MCLLVCILHIFTLHFPIPSPFHFLSKREERVQDAIEKEKNYPPLQPVHYLKNPRGLLAGDFISKDVASVGLICLLKGTIEHDFATPIVSVVISFPLPLLHLLLIPPFSSTLSRRQGLHLLHYTPCPLHTLLVRCWRDEGYGVGGRA